jgi:ribosomal-protein-alanine N-acetyltransferase
VRLDNAAAIPLYRSLGWRDAGRRRGYYHDGTDALLLRLDLGDSP